MTPVLVALIGLAGNLIVASAFTLMGRAHAKERSMLLNAALSGNSYEFAVRQNAIGERPPTEPVLEMQFPEGL